VTWLPFDLHPEYPPEGLPRERLLTRYGEAGIARTRAMFEANGLDYNPHPDVVPNTRTALRLTELARDRGLHEPVHTRLMHAYWSEGVDIGDHEALLAVTTGAGLKRDEAARAIAGDGYAERVLDSTRRAQAHGINAIPAFVLDNRLLVLGAHPHEAFESAFEMLDQGTED
jgi:predicted DsbA family dithiol-disulfide isomerase